jgi:asparagine synthase (glutamine-hydrolysing)
MCGIAGLWEKGRETHVGLAAVLQAMRHRGPDGQRAHDFDGGSAGMVRLALVDLSERGQQPLWSPDGLVAILFNGEMYNFRAERQRLDGTFPFRSSTDTEVVLALYLEMGPSFVEALRGMFALAILDWREAGAEGPPKLLLARDRFGIKPLYVAGSGDGGIAFASEIKGLLASGLVAPEVDPIGLASYFRHGFLVQPRCIVRGVRMLEAGTVEIHEPGGATKRLRFGSLPAAVARPESLRDAADRLRSVLEQSVALHALADAPVGAFLSGGVDSTGIVALMLRHLPRLRTYSLGWVGGGAPDETPEAEATAQRLGCEHTSVLVPGREVAEVLSRFARDLDQPSIDGLNTWFVSRVAAREVKGVLSGLGGDEWFAGYPVASRMARFSSPARGAAVRLAGRMASTLSGPLAGTRLGARLENWSSYRSPLALWLGAHSVFSDGDTAKLLGRHADETGEERIVRALLADGSEPSEESVASLACRLDAGVYMRSQLLRDGDATSMAHSLELRVPFVDAEVAAFARSCDDRYKVDAAGAGRTYRTSGAKRVLIEALRDLLPPGIENRPKRGFAMPYETWMRGPLREIALDCTSGETVRARGLLSPPAVADLRRRVESHEPGAAYPKLWSLMILELWCREVLDPARSGGRA